MPPSEPVSFDDRDFQPKPSKRDVALARNTIALCDADADWSDAETHISTALAQTRREALEQAALMAFASIKNGDSADLTRDNILAIMDKEG